MAENFTNIRCDRCRTIKVKKHDYRKVKVNKLKENSKNKYIWKMYKYINEFKRGY